MGTPIKLRNTFQSLPFRLDPRTLASVSVYSHSSLFLIQGLKPRLDWFVQFETKIASSFLSGSSKAFRSVPKHCEGGQWLRLYLGLYHHCT